MPSLSSISDPKVYHILTYGTLLGSNIQNTFFAGPIAYSCLPRPQFATLQTKIFPVFFSFQSVLPLLLAATFPGSSSTALKSPENDTGMRGLLMEHNLWSALLPISLMFATSALNLVLLGPATTRVMRKRKHQGRPLFNLSSGMARNTQLTIFNRNKRRQKVL